MSTQPRLRRLIDLAGISDLEFKAVMKPAYREPEARAEFPEIDACSVELFGLTADEAENVARPSDWDGVEHRPIAEQVAAFEAAGWDVTDDKRRPLKMLEHFNQQLWLAARGVAGALPFLPDDDQPEAWTKKLADEASRFRRR
jgi:hypothetical protein